MSRENGKGQGGLVNRAGDGKSRPWRGVWSSQAGACPERDLERPGLREGAQTDLMPERRG